MSRSLLLLVGLFAALSTLACRRAAPAFATDAQALRHYHNVQRFFPDVEPPAWFLAMAPGEEEAAGQEGGPAEEEGEPGEGEAEEEKDDPGPPEIPRPQGIDFRRFRFVGTSGNWAGAPKGAEGECPCETAMDPEFHVMYFNADPRRPNPPDPDPGNGLFPATWQNCLAQVREPRNPPSHACTQPCGWESTRVEDWTLDTHPNGVWLLTCYKMDVYHCTLGVET